MKKEQVIYEYLSKIYKFDKNVKVAVLNGSRANSNAPIDFMRDYDIALYVDCLEEALMYKSDQTWISVFGDLVILQQNDFGENSFIFLLQYEDGLRIDLSFHDMKSLKKNIEGDSLSILLYDRDHILDDFPESNESSYFVKKPTREKWDETLNELWWLQPYIAKELWRDEVPLAKELYDVHLFDCLRDLLSWHIAIDQNWCVNVGHGGKWFKNLLNKEIYEEYIDCYSNANKNEQWRKLFNIGNFIRKIATPLSHRLGYEYPEVYDFNVSKYVQQIYSLPSNASSLYSIE